MPHSFPVPFPPGLLHEGWRMNTQVNRVSKEEDRVNSVRNKSQHSFRLVPSFPLLPKLEPSTAHPSTVPGGPADVEL